MKRLIGWCINGLDVLAAAMAVLSLSVALGLEQEPWKALAYFGIAVAALALSCLLGALSDTERWTPEASSPRLG